MNKFVEWLAQQIEQRGWTYQEFADRGEITRSSISMIMSNNQNPGIITCTGIALALKIDPIEVLRLAGHLPPAPGDTGDKDLRDLWQLITNLPPDHVSKIRDYAMYEDYLANIERERQDTPTITPPTDSNETKT